MWGDRSSLISYAKTDLSHLKDEIMLVSASVYWYGFSKPRLCDCYASNLIELI